MSHPNNFPYCYQPWLSGRIGGVESRVCRALLDAKHNNLDPVPTGWLVKQVYLGEWGRATRRASQDGPPPKVARWMYANIRRACLTYGVRVGRLEARGFPVLWRLKDDVSTWSIRKEKTARDAKRRRRLARLQKNNIKEVR